MKRKITDVVFIANCNLIKVDEPVFSTVENTITINGKEAKLLGVPTANRGTENGLWLTIDKKANVGDELELIEV